ncbi:hypothetical protein JCM10295v2_007087 [Rhodotorula toruloides]
MSHHGDSILLGSNASKLLMRWGVGIEMYEQTASKGESWLFKDKDGERIWEENLGELYGAPILQGRRAAFLGSLGVEARLLGAQIRLNSEVVKYWDAEDEPAVVLRGGEVVRGETYTHRDAGHSASLDWRDRKPIDEVQASLRNWDPVLQRVIGYFPSSLHWEILDQPPEEEWICFIGDSVHGMMPTSFQGGSQAVEDGATVAMCLALSGGGAHDVELALERFQRMRRARVKEAQALGRKQQDVWHRFTTTLPRPPPASLRPLSFDLYDHDAEAFAISHFARYARQVDPTFQGATLEVAANEAQLETVTRN